MITPLTDRSMLGLTNAMAHNYGGALYGDVASGKTETIRELARCFGMFCTTANCNTQQNLSQITALLKGTIQAGTWIILDNFQNLDDSVMSVVGEHFHTLFTAKVAGFKKFNFDGCDMPLNPRSNCFLTTWYKSHQESVIPDNIRGFFRPIALLRNNVAFILEATLLSQGFLNSKALTEKILTLLRVTKEQLASSSRSYMPIDGRSLVSISNITLALKGRENDMTEDQIVLSAIQRVIPKMLNHSDAKVFQLVLSKFFPETEPVDVKDPNVCEAIQNTCNNMKLQCTPYFLERAASLHETLGIHTGIIIVGEPCSGKSTLVDVMAETYASFLNYSI